MRHKCSEVLSALKGKTLVTAESLTGGGIGSALTAVPGSSEVYKGGVISYTDWVKHNVLGVREEDLQAYGAVSEPVARQMAEGARSLLKADVAVSVTGLAGPGGDEYGNPLGTVFIGYAEEGRSVVEHHCFQGSREEIRNQTIQAALSLILKMRKYCMLELRYVFEGFEQCVYPVVLFGERDRVLVDCGYPGSLGMLEEQLRLHDIPPETITKLLLTHQDDDHIGSAREWKEKYPQTQILSSLVEAPYISGEKKNLRLQQAERMQSTLPEGQQDWGEQFCQRYRSLRPVAIDLAVEPGDGFDWGGGCEILATPGHTPGHISIRARNGDFCVTGDAAVVEDGKLEVANPQFCLNLENAEKSLEEILRRPCGVYLCYHGGAIHV